MHLFSTLHISPLIHIVHIMYGGSQDTQACL